MTDPPQDGRPPGDCGVRMPKNRARLVLVLILVVVLGYLLLVSQAGSN
jgi:hypothetical protein